MNNPSHADIAIIGGGLVGYTAALAFAQAGFSVNIFESKALDLNKLVQTEGRAIALAYTSCILYQSLGIWPAMQQQATPIKQINISEQNKFGKCRIKARDYDLPALGHVVPATHLVKCLYEAVKSHNNIQLRAPFEVTHLENDDLQACINHAYTSQFILACDGKESFAREYFKLGETEKSYHQQAVVANVTLNISHDYCAHQRFTNSGVLALLPLEGHRMTSVLTLDKNKFGQLPLEDEYLKLLQNLFGKRNGLLSELGQRFDYSLDWMEANRIVIGRTILLGNAAHTISPIVAQGLNIALRDLALLYDCIGENRVDEYQQRSKDAQKKVLQFTDRLTDWVKPNSLGLFRSVGLHLLDHTRLLKDPLALSLMGLSSHTGSLMKEGDHVA